MLKQCYIFDHTTAESTDTCYNMDEPWKCYVKERSQTKTHTLYDLRLYEKSKIGKSIEKGLVVARAWWKGKWE